MRKIAFRAWDKKENRWCGFNLAGFVLIDEANKKQQGIQWGTKTENQVLMQFTGLTDKNGKEIYEGDIVVEATLDWKWEVYFDNEKAGFWCRNNMTSEGILGSWNEGDDPAYPRWGEYEIIGNVYENPELLK